ncbi:hypothetical protein EON65_26420 [archaeon]|nr:MAG: hypothetical protein EON65_26420 [archaeon]
MGMANVQATAPLVTATLVGEVAPISPYIKLLIAQPGCVHMGMRGVMYLIMRELRMPLRNAPMQVKNVVVDMLHIQSLQLRFLPAPLFLFFSLLL